jgi:hypothetical protein
MVGGWLMQTSSQSDIAHTLREIAPLARRLLMELQSKKRYGDFPALLAFFDLMRRWGVAPDPDGSHCLMAGYSAGGPEISVADAIRIRAAFQVPRTSLDLRGLSVSDQELAAIPDDVTALVLKDSPITDAGIPRLLKLSGLKRLNIAGTQITDAGLVALGSLPKLEWVCANRTHATADGAQRLKAILRDAEIVIGSEP